MGRMGRASRLDRASTLLGTEIWQLGIHSRPTMTVFQFPRLDVFDSFSRTSRWP